MMDHQYTQDLGDDRVRITISSREIVVSRQDAHTLLTSLVETLGVALVPSPFVPAGYRFQDEDRTNPIRVEQRGAETWCVIRDGFVLANDGEWEWEPQPSSRDEAFIRRTRFPLTVAMERAIRARAAGPDAGV